MGRTALSVPFVREARVPPLHRPDVRQEMSAVWEGAEQESGPIPRKRAVVGAVPGTAKQLRSDIEGKTPMHMQLTPELLTYCQHNR